MKKLINSLAFGLVVFLANNAIGQTVIWTETFSNACASGCFANAYVGPNGAWTQTLTGANGVDANQWFISGSECGNNAGACGTGCGAVDPSLHLGANLPLIATVDPGAAYAAGGGGFFFIETDVRIESPTIDLTGESNITLNFNYMDNYTGSPTADPFDVGDLWYFDGAVWALLDNMAITGAGCAPQGTWTAYSIALPASADNNANVKIGFHWFNDDDNIGGDPSFAVDDITLTVPTVGGPTVSFSASLVNICEGTCIDFTDLTVLGPGPYVFDWDFTGATPATSAAQNPTGICYNTAGLYSVSLEVTDGSGTGSQTFTNYITVAGPADAGTDAAVNVCNNSTLNLNTSLVGADPGGVWTETSGTPSGQFTPGTGILDGNGLTVGNVYTFDYIVTATAPCVGTDVATITVTVQNCTPGVITASFTPSQTTICVGDCITFAEASFGAGIIGWGWQFTNGTPATAITQNPGSVCFNVAGAQDVTLTITDGVIFDDTTITITVNSLPIVTANANPGTTVCAGDPVTLTGSGAASYVWNNGAIDGLPFTPASTLTYTVTGTAVSGCENTANVTITVVTCVPMIAGFSYPDNICMGDCITFTDTTTGAPNSWTWDFGGGSTPNTSTDQNPVVCFDAIGTFNIQLTTTDAGGNTSSTTNSISVFGMPLVIAELDTVIEIGGSAVMSANGSGPGSYWWSPDYGNIDCDTCSTTFAFPEVDTNYVVTFTDVNGCTATDSIRVYVNFIEAIGVPQAFSPNGDDNNDILFVKGFGITTMKFVIYNRYGEVVFETTDQNIGWDGTFKNRDENPGVFVWVLEYTVLTGKGGLMSGNTTLVR